MISSQETEWAYSYNPRAQHATLPDPGDGELGGVLFQTRVLVLVFFLINWVSFFSVFLCISLG